MKKLLCMKLSSCIFYLSLLLFFSFPTYSQDFSNPAEYNDYIVGIQGQVLQQNVNYVMESVHNEDYEQVEKKRKQLITTIEGALEKVAAMPAYDDNSVFKDEAAAVFNSYLETFKIEFKEANLLKEKRQESYESMEKFYEAQDQAEKKLEKASDKLIAAQKAFAKKYDMEIMEAKGYSSTQNMIRIINRVNGYTRVVFLAYFKVSKDDASVLDAMEEKNPGKMDAFRKKLLISIDEGLMKLEKLGPYGNEDEFRQSAIELLNFHKTMAEDGYPDIIQFLQKKRSELTQEDVDMYNGVINLLNSQPPILLSKFNELNADFFKKHIPGGGART